MIISKKSWHYRLNEKVHNKYTLNRMGTLCEYMRATMASLFIVVISIICIIAALFLAVMPVVGAFIELPEQLAAIQIIGTGVYVILIVVGSLTFLIKRVKEALHNRKTVKKKSTNIFKEYYLAHKNKFCPTIKIEDD
ncbi:membrane protein [Vibrio phage Vp_R1]|uniref:Uncharacterized protein n=1 Tax=Vibrio phage Vp_R1 TaxID=2059867 RepID=A0A2H5BQ01_9CAUD|nr:membrane protein [Vibrio phage Vp_R1]AUG88407.1 hypothetical protein VPR_043 [Vibrio phage Vp_R1]